MTITLLLTSSPTFQQLFQYLSTSETKEQAEFKAPATT